MVAFDKIESAAIGLGLLAVTAVAAFAGGLERQVVYEPLARLEQSNAAPLALDASTDEVLARFQGPPGQEYRGADLASYLRQGLELRSSGGFHPAFLPYWPPGMAWLSAMMVGAFGNAAYPAKMIGLSVVLWGGALWLIVWSTGFTGRFRWYMAAGVSTLWLLPAHRTWTFGFGSVMSEASSHALFFGGLACVVGGVMTDKLRPFLAGGVFIGLATLIRAFFEYAGLFMFGLAPMVMMAGWFWYHRREGASWRYLWVRVRTVFHPGGPRVVKCAAFLLGVLLVSQAVLLPWRAYKFYHFDTGSLLNFQTRYTWNWAWVPDDQLPWFHHGGNAACHANQELCRLIFRQKSEVSGKLQRDLALLTLVRHPWKWMKLKARKLNWLWIGRDWASIAGNPALWIEGLVLLGLGLGGFTGLGVIAWRRRSVEAVVLLSVAGAFVAMNVTVFTVFQFEWRYAQGVRELMVFLPMWALAVHRRS